MSELALNPVLGDRTRLMIMVTLASAKRPLEFMELLQILKLTRGNLSSHLAKLEEEKFVAITKEFIDRKPRTTCACTAHGRREIKSHLEQMERLLKQLK